MERSESGITMRGKTGDAMDRPGWRSSFLGDPGATFLCGKLGRGTKKEKSSKKERTEGLWKLTLLMEIRKGRGFPQPLEKRLAKDARLFHSSHRPNNKDLFTIIYCRHDQKPWNGMCANSKLSQQRGSPQELAETSVPIVASKTDAAASKVDFFIYVLQICFWGAEAESTFRISHSRVKPIFGSTYSTQLGSVKFWCRLRRSTQHPSNRLIPSCF